MNYKSKFTGKQIDDGIDKANSAYQKPQNGIPLKDLSEGVQNSLDNALQSITTMEGTVNTAEQGRKDAESERVTAEQARKTAESARETAEAKRASAETERQSAEDARKEAEAARVTAENGRATAEDGRSDAESRRQDNESARVTAETEREQGFTEKAAHLDELLQYIKDNHLEPDAKLAEAIKNAINGTDEFVYLDTNDGNVKSMPNTNQLGANVASVYYAGKRSIGLGERCQMFSARNTLVRNFDLSGWDFEAATDMSQFLIDAQALRTLTLPDNMTLSNVTTMRQCFRTCFSLQSIDMSKCTLSNVTNMVQCFISCSSLREIDLSSCNITRCTNWDLWIFGCNLLETLKIGLIDFSLCGAVDFLSGTNIRELTGTLKGIKNNFTAKSTRMTRDSCMVVINGLETVTEAKTLTLGANNKPVSLGGKGNDPILDDDLKIATDKGWTVQFA